MSPAVLFGLCGFAGLCLLTIGYVLVSLFERADK